MAGLEEYTTLLDVESNQTYANLGYGSRQPSTASSIGWPEDISLSVDEFLYRLQYAFLNQGYDVESDLRAVLQYCDDADVSRLLQDLNSAPLSMQQKLKISRLLHTEGNLKGRYRKGKNKKIQKQQDVHWFLRPFHIWEGTLTNLTAYFGSNVASFFRFIRTLLYINMFMAVLLVAFITVPEIIQGNLQSNVTYGGHFGELSNSIMFYGMYSPRSTNKYNLPLAYFLTWLITNLMCFVFIITIMTVRYRKSKLSEEKGSEFKFAWRTFCTWDYSISSRQAVIDQRTSLRTDIKEIVREEKSTITVPVCTRVTRYLGRLFSNVVVLGLLMGSGFLIYKVAEGNILHDSAPDDWKDFFKKYQKNRSNGRQHATVVSDETIELTAVVAGLKFLVPPIFQQLVLLEGWHPRIETKITLARTTLFYIASLTIFVYSLYEVSNDCVIQTDNKDRNTTTTPPDSANSDFPDNEKCCWENEVGEEVFKVILVDLGLLIVVGIIVHLMRALLVRCTCKKIGYSKFDIVSCILDVIYGQGLIWLGLYFSPLLAVLGVIKLVMVFYFRYFIAKVAMVPPQQLFRASSTGNFYLAILLLNLFVSLFPLAYAVIEFNPSPECGPFRNYDRPYGVVSSLIGDLPNWLEDIVEYITTPAIVVPILIFLLMCIVYFKVKFSSYRRLVDELRKQLKFERKVEKRKIFATGRAMSGGALSRFTSQESLASNITQPGARYRQQKNSNEIIEEEHDI